MEVNPIDYISGGAVFTRNILCKISLLKKSRRVAHGVALSTACGVGLLLSLQSLISIRLLLPYLLLKNQVAIWSQQRE